MLSGRSISLWLWPAVLVVAGVLLLLHNYLLLEFNALQLWPLLLVGLGVQAIARGDLGLSWETQNFGITRGSVQSGTLRANGGELDVHIERIAREDRLVAGQYTARSRPELEVVENHATLTLLRERTWFFSLGDWSLALAGNLPWDMLVSTHLGEIELDLRGLVVSQARIASGIGDIHLTLPDNPAGPIEVRSTFGNISLTMPENMEAILEIKGSPLFRVQVEDGRWQQREAGLYVTAGYDGAVEPLTITAGGTFGDLTLS